MNNIVYRCKLPLSKQRKLRDLFLSGSTARAAARVVGVNRMTGILFFRKLREKIAVERIAEQKKNRDEKWRRRNRRVLHFRRQGRAQGCATRARTCGENCVRRSHWTARASGANRTDKEREPREFDKLHCAQCKAGLRRAYWQLQELLGRAQIRIQALPRKPFSYVQRQSKRSLYKPNWIGVGANAAPLESFLRRLPQQSSPMDCRNRI